MHIRVETKRLAIENVRGRNRFFVRYFAVDCEARADMIDIGNRTPIDMFIDAQSLDMRCAHVMPHFGGCVYAHVVNSDNRVCVAQIGSFYVPLGEVIGGSRLYAASLPIENYSLMDSVFDRGEPIDCRQGTISFVVETVSAPADLRQKISPSAACFQTASSSSTAATDIYPIDKLNEIVFTRYIKKFFDVCVGPARKFNASAPKLEAYHVPNFVTYSGVQLPASASLLWRPHVRDWHDFDSALISAARVAVSCYPEISSFDMYLELIARMTDMRAPLSKLDEVHSSALRASVEVLTQLSTIQPYLEDTGFGKDSTGRWRQIGDDQYCPVTESDGTDCEDGAQYACQLKRLIEMRSSVIPALSRLFSYFSHYIAIMYCADNEPEQNDRDQGLCHVACMLIPKTASCAIVACQSASCTTYPRELRWSNHWIRHVGLIVPETTAITDCRVYPTGETDELYRRETEAARNVVLNFAKNEAGTYMNRDTFVSKRGGGMAKYMNGYYASGFYQWITNVWSVECNHTLDLLPIYSQSSGGGSSPPTWGVRVRDLSAQILRVQKLCPPETMRKYFGQSTLARIDTTPIRFVHRTLLDREVHDICIDVLNGHVPPYKALPDKISPAKTLSVQRTLVDAIRAQPKLERAMKSSILDGASYVRLDLYTTDFVDIGAFSIGSRSRADNLMSRLNSLFEAEAGFYACRLIVSEIYPGRDSTKPTILLFYDRKRIDRTMARTGDRTAGYSKRGNFN